MYGCVMSRTKGAKNFNRRLLQEVLEEKGFDLVAELIGLYSTAADLDTKARILMHMMEFVFPKRRPEDSAGEPENPQAGVVFLSNEELVRLAAGKPKIEGQKP